MSDFLFHVPNYVLYRNDRSQRTGGGMAIWLRSHFSSATLNTTQKEPTFGECLWVIINNYFMLYCCYTPPALNAANQLELITYLSDSLDDLKNKYPNAHTVICGDFNQTNYSRLT